MSRLDSILAPLIAKQLFLHGDKAPPADYRLFWAKVDRDPETQHWIWTGAWGKGYGMWREGKGKIVMAHRLAWRLVMGEEAQGWLRVNCGRVDCINPMHRRFVRPGVGR